MASRQRQAKPQKRDGFWYLIRRVPEQFAALDRRRKVSLSTGIRVADDPRTIRARQAVQELDARLQSFWRQKRDGKDASAEQRYRDALRRARELDIPYLPNHELPKLPLQDLWKRFLILTASCPSPSSCRA